MEDAEVVASSEWLIAPPTHYKTGAITREYDERARLIHGYTLEHLQEHGKKVDRVCFELREFVNANGVQNHPVVAYNAGYDLPMLGTLMFLAGQWDRDLQAFVPFLPPISGPWQDAFLLAKRRIDGLTNYKLDTVAAYFGLSRQGERHGALEDAILAGRVFTCLREAARQEAA